MAKRRAEPLVCHAPAKRLPREPPPPPPRAHERRPRGAGGGAGGEPGPASAGAACRAGPKRPLEEAEEPPGKRAGTGTGTGTGAGRRRQGGPEEPRDERAAEGCAGGRSEGRAPAAATAEQEEEEFYQYNSFLYWRAPLPTLDLSDIQNLDEETPSNVKTSSRTDATETEMET